MESSLNGIHTGLGLAEILADALTLLSREGGDQGKNTSQSDRNIVNVIHHANGFAGKWHTGS
ncbi:MAG TPA: hypothetical protein VK670_15960 [Silvibacterium sp.]|nr:hypothetical protein [Silvibacterium sp.]